MSEWYFMSGDEQQGPVTAAQLKALAAAGTLQPEDLVWNQKMTEWAPARRVKGLPFTAQPAAKPAAAAQSAASSRAPVAAPASEPDEESAPPEMFGQSEPGDEPESEPVSEPTRKVSSARSAGGSLIETAELLGESQTWVGVMSLLFLAGIALVVAYEFWRVLPVVKGANNKALMSKLQTVWGLRQIVRSLCALLMLIPWLMLVRFGSALGRAKTEGGAQEVNHAIKRQKSFWKSMAMTSILVIVMVAGAFAYKMVLKK